MKRVIVVVALVSAVGRASARTVRRRRPRQSGASRPDRRADAPRIRHALGAIPDDPAHGARAREHGPLPHAAHRHHAATIRPAGRMAQPWLQGLNSGDHRGAAVSSRHATAWINLAHSSIDCPRRHGEPLKTRMPRSRSPMPSRRLRAIRSPSCAGIAGPLQQAMQALESDVLATRSSYHE